MKNVLRNSIVFHLLMLCPIIANSQVQEDKIRIQLENDDSKIHDVIIQFKPLVASTSPNQSKTEKGIAVFDQLRVHAQTHQRNVIEQLEEQNTPHRSFWIANALCARVNEVQLSQIAANDDVQFIISNDPFPGIQEPIATTKRSGQPTEQVTWGIELIGADQVWEMGIRGEGVVVAGQDTGFDFMHPSLFRNYRGFLGNGSFDHNYNWHDAIREINPLHADDTIAASNNPCGLDVPFPCDDGIHGTHTMGTMVGYFQDSLWHIGVAPQAQWIGVRNMERGFGKPETYLEAFQWLLAPTDLNGNNPDPSKAPHVINNSWSCPEFEGCNPDNWGLIETAIQNLKAAGIVVVVSAGNSGSNCETIQSPPAIFEPSLTVGAVDRQDKIAGFSSRGPVTVDGSNLLKPNVSAPGVEVFSAATNNRFASLSGTSMAGPHVAGVVALMISANPEIAGQVDLIESILEETAIYKQEEVACTDDARHSEIQNATYGFGRIDALAAVERVLTITSTDRMELQTAIHVSPNPVTTELKVTTEVQSQMQLVVYNSSGMLIYQQKEQGSNEHVIATKDWPAGYYFLHVVTAEGIGVRKLIKH